MKPELKPSEVRLLMRRDEIDEPPSQMRMVATLSGVVLLAAFNGLLLQFVRDKIPADFKDTKAWSASTDITINCIFLLEALVFCAFTWQTSGLGIGTRRNWKKYAWHIAFVWIMPPLIVLSLYPTLTDKPFHARNEWTIGWWLIGSVAQELMFGGFIYGRLASLFGAPATGNVGAFSAPVLVTAFLYALSHWPNLQISGHGMTPQYVLFQFAYTFFGFAWILNIRRWTGSVWPLAANHVLVNYLATVV